MEWVGATEAALHLGPFDMSKKVGVVSKILINYADLQAKSEAEKKEGGRGWVGHERVGKRPIVDGTRCGIVRIDRRRIIQ